MTENNKIFGTIMLLGLLFIGLWVAASKLTQYVNAQSRQLGEVSCKDNKPPFYVSGMFHFIGFKSEGVVNVWMCKEQYEELTKE